MGFQPRNVALVGLDVTALDALRALHGLHPGYLERCGDAGDGRGLDRAARRAGPRRFEAFAAARADQGRPVRVG